MTCALLEEELRVKGKKITSHKHCRGSSTTVLSLSRKFGSTIRKMAEVPVVESAEGFKMPLIGFGTWQISNDDLEDALECALETGYRHIDTAFGYGNEISVGNVLKRWFDAGKLTREEVFITTKLPFNAIRPEHVQKFMDLSLQNLQVSYVDMYLIHLPFAIKYHGDNVFFPMLPDGNLDVDFDTDHVATWKEMEKQVLCGKTRAIGISNFSISQTERILNNATIRPATNQIQLHVYYQQPDLVKYLTEKGIIVTSYSNLGTIGSQNLFDMCGIQREMPRVLEDPTVLEIANELNRAPAQVLLRHWLQQDIVVIPKSITPKRIQENFALLDFELTESQMNRMNALDRDMPSLVFSEIFKGVQNHPEYYFPV